MTSCKVVCQQGCCAPLLDDPAVRLPDYEILIIFDKKSDSKMEQKLLGVGFLQMNVVTLWNISVLHFGIIFYQELLKTRV